MGEDELSKSMRQCQWFEENTKKVAFYNNSMFQKDCIWFGKFSAKGGGTNK